MTKETIRIEHRSAGGIQAAIPAADDSSQRRVTGYAHKYGSVYEFKAWIPSDAGEWGWVTVREEFNPGAFDCADISPTYFRHNHDMVQRGLAHQRNGSLVITADNVGLHFDARLSDTQAGRDLYTDVKSGLTTEMSFAFTVDDKDSQSVKYTRLSEDLIERRIMKVSKIFDVSTVDYPAYEGTAIDAKGKMETGDNSPEKRMVLPGLTDFILNERQESEGRKNKLALEREKLKIKLKLRA